MGALHITSVGLGAEGHTHPPVRGDGVGESGAVEEHERHRQLVEEAHRYLATVSWSDGSLATVVGEELRKGSWAQAAAGTDAVVGLVQSETHT